MAPIGRVKPGDQVQCNIRGRIFWATVLERIDGGLKIEPPHGVNYFHVTARQVTNHKKAEK